MLETIMLSAISVFQNNFLLRNSKEVKYTPKLDFNGKTECRTLNFNYAEAH